MLRLVFVGLITGRECRSRPRAGGAGGDRRARAGRVGTRRCGGCRRTPTSAPALDRLREGGLTLCALTNSPLESVTAELEHAGIADRFEAILSAEGRGRLKPAPEPYHHAADHFGVGIGDVTLVACHAWDCAGAMAAGARRHSSTVPECCPRSSASGRASWAATSTRSPPSCLAPPSGCAPGWPCGPAPAAGRSPSAAPP